MVVEVIIVVVATVFVVVEVLVVRVVGEGVVEVVVEVVAEVVADELVLPLNKLVLDEVIEIEMDVDGVVLDAVERVVVVGSSKVDKEMEEEITTVVDAKVVVISAAGEISAVIDWQQKYLTV